MSRTVSLLDTGNGMTGMVAFFAQSSAPIGWLVCDGLAVSRTTYVYLFNAIGTTYGSGNGSTTFNLPDLRGCFARGLDLSRGLDPSRSLGSYQSDALVSHTHSTSVSLTTNGTHAHTVTGSTSTAGHHGHSVGGSTSGVGDHVHGYTHPPGGKGGCVHHHGTTYFSDMDGAYWTGTGGAGAHSHSISGWTDGQGNHTHTVSGSTDNVGDHTHTATASVSSVGGSENRPKNVALLPCIKH